jgi:hypothetical protein
VFARAALGAAVVLSLINQVCHAAPIASGNLVILRTGTGGASSLTTNATAVYLDEYTPAGTLVQSLAMPTSGTTAFTLSGSQQFEGILSRSQDGTLITFAGYRKAVGGSNPMSDAPSVTNRVIGTLNQAGVFSTALAISNATGSVSSAATVDGSSFYLTGSALGGTGPAVNYINATSGTVAVTATISGRATRQAILSGNHLLVSNGAAVARKIEDYGVLPTAGVPSPGTLVSISSTVNVHGFFLADLNPAIPGDDVMYLVNESGAGQLMKYTFDGSAWQASGAITSGTMRNVTGVVSGSTVTLYTTSPTGLSTLTDASGIGGTLTGSLTSILNAPTNTNFRGISVFVPEPTGLTLILGLAAGLALRRRRA